MGRTPMPTTEAGKRLLARLAEDVPWFIADGEESEKQMVVAIEAEARDDANARLSAAHQSGIEVGRNEERERIRAAVKKYIAHHSHEKRKNCVSAFCPAGLHAAILRIIDGGEDKNE